MIKIQVVVNQAGKKMLFYLCQKYIKHNLKNYQFNCKSYQSVIDVISSIQYKYQFFNVMFKALSNRVKAVFILNAKFVINLHNVTK